jgi:EthD domain
MEKVVYLVWKTPAQPAADFAAQVRALPPALIAAGARRGRINIADADVAPAVGLRQALFKPPPDAVVQAWVDSAIARLREGVDAAIRRVSEQFTPYLVTESQPTINARHPPQPGQRTYGFAQIALLRKPARLSHEEWIDVWHNSHTQVAIETQSTFEYVQNVVTRPLAPHARPIAAIVEECFPPEAMTDFKAFFDAPGDEPKFKANFQRMLQSVARFIEPGQIDVIPTSQYVF